MKTRRILTFLAILTPLAFAGLLSSCVTTQGGSSKQALVCPQCRSATFQPKFYEDVSETPASLHEVEEHQCPGCKGGVTSILKNGKWTHECSICANSPYSCSVHR